MLSHHKRAVERLVADFSADPQYLALLVGGSIAKGRERPDSDVDLLLITTEEEFARRQEAGEFWYFNPDAADWPGGYVEGKIVSPQFLRDVADHGSEPARSAFVGAQIGFSRIPDLAELIATITAYPEHEREEKMASFYSQAMVLNWFVPEAEKRQDAYLLAWASSNLVLYGGRLILAYNRILYPFHKWFMHELRHAPDKPAGFMDNVDALLARPGKETANAFFDCITSFRDWGVSLHQANARFTINSEWNWRDGHPPLGDS